MADHTPGPWQTRFIYRMIRRVRESPADLLIGSHPENDWADASLMTAAPDLLDACKLALSMNPNGVFDSDEPEGQQLRAAIAKAEGRDP